MLISRITVIAASAVVLVSLAACGGGGAAPNGGANPVTPEPPVTAPPVIPATPDVPAQPITAVELPLFSQQPVSQIVEPGATVTLSVAVRNSALSYQWTRNGFAVAGATGSSYTLTAQAQDSGSIWRVAVTNAGGMSRSEAAVLSVLAPPSTPLRTLAGLVDEQINDSAWLAAHFSWPIAVAQSTTGHFLVTDVSRVFRVSSTGEVSLLANLDYACTFYNIVATTDGGMLGACNNAVYKVNQDGKLTLIAGKPGEAGLVDGAAEQARFGYTSGIALDRVGNIYVGDSSSQTLRKITPDGRVTTLAGNGKFGAIDGTGSNAGFSGLRHLATDPEGNVLVLDGYAVRKITPAGVVTTLAGNVEESGSVDGPGAQGRFGRMLSLTVDKTGTIFVLDSGTNSLRKVSADGQVSTVAWQPSGYVSGQQFGVSFNYNAGIVAGIDGNLYLYDETENGQLRKISPSGLVSLVVGAQAYRTQIIRQSEGLVDGKGAAARLFDPRGMAVDASGNLMVTDYGNRQLRKVTLDGTVATPLSKAQIGLNIPNDVAVDGNNNTYLIGPFDGVVKLTAAGALSMEDLPTAKLVEGYGGPEARAIAADAAGNVYFAFRVSQQIDPSCYSTGHISCPRRYKMTINKLTPAGQFLTLASSDSFPYADFADAGGMAVDGSGNIYVSDSSRNAIVKFTQAGVASVLSGLPGASGSVDGMGGAARFLVPGKMAIDAAGNLYVSDTGNFTVRKVTPAGLVSTVAGTVGKNQLVLGGLPGSLSVVKGLAVLPGGKLAASVDNGIITITPP